MLKGYNEFEYKLEEILESCRKIGVTLDPLQVSCDGGDSIDDFFLHKRYDSEEQLQRLPENFKYVLRDGAIPTLFTRADRDIGTLAVLSYIFSYLPEPAANKHSDEEGAFSARVLNKLPHSFQMIAYRRTTYIQRIR